MTWRLTNFSHFSVNNFGNNQLDYTPVCLGDTLEDFKRKIRTRLDLLSIPQSGGKNVKIQLWNLGFVEAYQNSILRGQGLST